MTNDALKLNDPNQFGSQQTSDGVVDLLTPVQLLWIRDVPIATTSLVAADTTKKVLVFDADASTIPYEGTWVNLSTTTGYASAATVGTYAYLVIAGRGRTDVPASEGVGVVMGGYVAETDRFITLDAQGESSAGAIDSSTTWGKPLAVTVAASGAQSGLSVLKEAQTGNRVVGFFEKLETRNGTSLCRFNTHGAGGIL